MKPQFFSMAGARQPINSTLCILFLVSWCIWILVYYAYKSVDAVYASYEEQRIEIHRQ